MWVGERISDYYFVFMYWGVECEYLIKIDIWNYKLLVNYCYFYRFLCVVCKWMYVYFNKWNDIKGILLGKSCVFFKWFDKKKD